MIASPTTPPDNFLSRSLPQVGLWFGFHLLLGALFILSFSTSQQWGGWKYRVLFVVYHWIVCGALWFGLFVVCGQVLRSALVQRHAWLRQSIVGFAGVVFVLVLLLWVTDWVTTLQWGGNLSDQLLWEVLRHWPDYARLLPLKIYVVLGVTGLLLWLLYVPWAAKFLPSFGVLMKGLPRPGFRLACVALLIAYALLFAALWHPWMVRWNYWQREPLVSFLLLSRAHWLFPEQAQAFLPATPRRCQATRDQQLRQSYPRGAVPKRNVILITVDSWRADHLPLYGYARPTTPFLSQLAAAGRLQKVADAHATCNATYCAVLSVLASRNVPDLGAGLFQLQDVLRDEGYRVHFLLSGMHTAWYNLRQLYGTSIDTYFDGTLARDYTANDDRGVLARLQEIPPFAAQPAFFYFHLMSPHLLGVRLAEYAEWQPASSKLRVYNSPEVNVNTYDNGVRMADAMIEQIFATLAAKGYLRDSFAVILGDHGEALGEHQHYSHGLGLYEEDLRIPLLVVDVPGTQYGDLSAAVQLDVAPTILARLGLPVPASWQGRSLLQAQASALSFHEAGFAPQRAVIFRHAGQVWKYLRSTATQAEELYELRTDPREEHNLVTQPAAAAILPQLRARLVEE
ncbi:MAG: sulfatase [Blastocatellia bacterium]